MLESVFQLSMHGYIYSAGIMFVWTQIILNAACRVGHDYVIMYDAILHMSCNLYAKQKQPVAVKRVLPSKVESMLYITECEW